MTTTRSKRKALGAAAPDLDVLPDRPASAAAHMRNHTIVTIEEIPDGCTGFQREGSSELEIPGSFAASPVYIGSSPEDAELDLDSDDMDERIAAMHISTLAGESTDEESCPPEARIDKGSKPESCPKPASMETCPGERMAEIGPGPSAYPKLWNSAFERTATPSFVGTAEATALEGNYSTTPDYQTPSRRARVYAKTPGIKQNGPKFFPRSANRKSNVHPTDVQSASIYRANTYFQDASLEPETEQRSDETMKQTTKPKRKKSAAHQYADDMAYMREIIKDKNRCLKLQAALPDVIPNNKSLLEEMREVLAESSGNEYKPSLWEDDIYGLEPASPVKATTESESDGEQGPTAGPSYFAKEKWVREEDYLDNQAYKARITAEKEARDEQNEEYGRPSKAKRPRPSLGVVVDSVRPARAHTAILDKSRNLKSSVAALPAGGYFAEQMRAKSAEPNISKISKARGRFNPPSDSSSNSEPSDSTSNPNSDSSGSSSELDSSDENNSRHITRKGNSKQRRNAQRQKQYKAKIRELKQKMKKAQQANVKLKDPSTYYGEDNYDQFELWSYQWDQWVKNAGLSDQRAVEYMASYLKGKAALWYMDHVAPSPSKYTVDSIKMGLFGYCFPADLKSQLREEFKIAEQGKMKITDYIQHLRRLQRRIPDITDQQICVKLWDTVQAYIQIKWIENGMNAEDMDLDTMCAAAERYEAAEMVKRRAETKKIRFKWPNQQFERRDEGRKSYQGNHKKSETDAKPATAPPKPQAGPSKTPQNKPKGQKPKTDKPKMSREERNELRAANKCFSCKEVGHTVKDCPKRTTAKPSTLYSAAIQPKYDLIEQLRKEREKEFINIASIRPTDAKSSTSTSYGSLEEITPAGSLLTEILDAITPYSQMVVAENDRFRITNERLLTVEMPYVEIAKQIRETYLEMQRDRARIETENNQKLSTIPEEGNQSKTIDEEEWEIPYWSESEEETLRPEISEISTQLNAMRLNVNKTKKADSSTKVIERNSARPKDVTRKLPKPLVVEATIDGHKVRALIDTGSLGDFISTTVVDQLKLQRGTLAKPIGLQMAVTGSRSSINHSVTARLGYQGIDKHRRFDVINIDNYDLILGTPFLYQYGVIVSFNPPKLSIGNTKASPIDRETALVIESLATQVYEERIEERREALRQYGADLCKSMAETPLLPFRAINHTIPLIDESKKYNTRRVNCPKPLQDLFDEKFGAYLNTGRWEYRPGINAIPMLIMMKKSKDGKIAVRTVLDKREINANTHKLASPLPDINEILMEVARHPYRSLIDGKDAYEQIRVVPEHVPRTLFMTPNRTMVSQVMQQGDCNAGATYQALMNHIFSEYVRKFMFVYLDDIIIFSDSAEEHEKHVKLVFDVLRKEKLYLSPHKMQLFAEKLEILGHVITSEGIRMDPHKVDAVVKWKVPTSKDLLASFLGAVGYLAPNCDKIQIPMGVLTKRASATQPWRWEATEQRAFNEIQRIVSEHRDINRVALDYSPSAPPINLTTDACCTGASGVVSQGEDLRTAKIVAFWSGKFTATQQNYPVHEQELLAIKESLERFKNLLLGTKVRVYTDHKALEHFSTQKKLSARQTRWMEKINEFDIEVKYIPGETNVLADALSRMYSNEPVGTVRDKSEYVRDTDPDAPLILVGSVRQTGPAKADLTEPLYVGDELKAELEARQQEPRRGTRERKQVEKYLNQPQRKHRTAKEAKPSGQEMPAEQTKDEESPKQTPDSPSKEAQELLKQLKAKGEKLEAKPKTALTECVTEFSLPDSLKGRYKEDPALEQIAADPKQYRNYEVRNDVLYLHRDDNLLLCVPDIKIDTRSVREVIISHAHSILAHLGERKTLQWLRTQVWWKTMVKDVQDFCKSCHTCAANKSSTRRPMGLLKAMPIPSYPWQSIGIDFVGPLPESTTRYGTFDMIMTVIDNLSRMVHLIATRQDYMAKDIAEVIFEHVYKLHGMPEKIVSDRDSLFMSIFWTKLAELTKTALRMSSAYHPQTDGMTERAQRTYTGLLRICAGKKQTEWAKNLPAIEFAINSARSEATGLSPFYLNYGRTPSLMIQGADSEFPGVTEHIGRIKLAIMAAHDAILDARNKMTKQANEHRRPADIKEGDLVYVSTKNMRMPKGFARKLAPKFVGPYKVAQEITQGASYEIELPKDVRVKGIHPVFHASLLRIHIPSDDRKFPGREYGQIATLGDAPQEWTVDRIVSHKGKGRKAIFELVWKTGDRTWEPYRNVRHLEALDAYCEAQGVPNVGKLESGPADEIEGSEPEDYELNSLWLVDVEDGYKTRGGNNEQETNPLDSTYTASQASDNSYSLTDMSADPSQLCMPTEALKTILAANNRVHENANETMLKAIGMLTKGGGTTNGGGKKKTHRQRDRIRNGGPYKGQRRNGPKTEDSPNDPLLGGLDWLNTGTSNAQGAQGEATDLLGIHIPTLEGTAAANQAGPSNTTSNVALTTHTPVTQPTQPIVTPIQAPTPPNPPATQINTPATENAKGNQGGGEDIEIDYEA